MKTAPVTWEQLTGLEEIQPADLNRVRVVLVFALASGLSLDDLFYLLLAPYYDHVQYDPMGAMACHIVYRLSDLVQSPRRRALITLGRFDYNDHTISLEDWREEWWSRFTKPEKSVAVVSGTPPELPL